MESTGWVDTPEGVVALECVESYVEGFLNAFESSEGLNAARHLSAPELVEGLPGCGAPSSVKQRTIELVKQAHECLNARPVDKTGALRAVRMIRRLWEE